MTVFEIVQKRYDDYMEAFYKGDLVKLTELEKQMSHTPSTYADLFKSGNKK